MIDLLAELARDKQGYLTDSSVWNEKIANAIAKEESIELTEDRKSVV